jgi:hypothetical protein
LSERAIHVGLLVGALALAGWVFGVQGRRAHSPPRSDEAVSPLAIIPAGSAFVLSADIAQLRQARVGALLAARFSRLGSSRGDLASLCGFDPLSALDQLVLAVPSAGQAADEHTDDFGVVATGHFSAAQISRCARAAVKERGGDPVDSELGRFHSVRDRTAAGGEVAARDGGPLIVSGGSYFRELLDAAEGHAGRRDAGDARHAELRRALGPGTIVATWLLGEHWFERVSGEDSDARLSALGALRQVGARVLVSDSAHVLLLLDCTDSDGAARISSLLSELRSSLHALPLNPALSALASRVSVSQTGARLKLAVDPEQAELSALFALLLGP